MVAVPLSNSSSVALVDDDDAPAVLKHRWRLTPKGYAVVLGKRTHLFMHRMITEAPNGVLVDHANRDTLDNRRGNLRLCTPAQNNWNRRAMGGSSRFKGVSLDSKSPRWRARIQGKCVGMFSDEESAARAYDKEAAQRYGEFAVLNFPLSDGDAL